MTKQIAIEILKQLGGNRFIAMTGAKHFVHDDKMMAFQIPMRNKIRGVRIYLNGMDTYDMEFLNRNFEVADRAEGIYNDSLQNVFTQKTGLYTHL